MESDLVGKIDLGKLINVRKIELDETPLEIEQLSKYTYLPSMTVLEYQEITLFNKNSFSSSFQSELFRIQCE